MTNNNYNLNPHYDKASTQKKIDIWSVIYASFGHKFKLTSTVVTHCMFWWKINYKNHHWKAETTHMPHFNINWKPHPHWIIWPKLLK